MAHEVRAPATRVISVGDRLGPKTPGLIQVYRLLEDTPGYLDRCRARYGRTFELRVPGIAPQLCFATRPEDIEAVLAMSIHDATGRGNLVIKRLLGENSVLFLEGDKHTAVKRLLRGALEEAGASSETQQARVRELVTGWSNGETRYLVSDFLKLTMMLSMDLVFGADAQLDRAGFANAMRSFLRSIRVPRLTDRDLGRFTPAWSYAGRRNEIYRRIESELERQRHQDGSPSLARALLRESEAGQLDHVADHVVSLLITSFDTVAVTLAWATYFILCDPKLAARARDEARSQASDPSFFREVVLETSRLRPVMPFFARTLTRDATLMDTTVRAGESVAISPWLTHRDPDVWEHPRRFDHTRFTGDNPPRSKWLPFGGGARGCIGMSHAIRLMPTVLEALFSDADLRLAPGYTAEVVRRGFLMSPRRGVPVVVDSLR